ncbi:MAG: hypothetical protein ACXWQO_18655 [Bdellovibrionota bacterium]
MKLFNLFPVVALTGIAGSISMPANASSQNDIIELMRQASSIKYCQNLNGPDSGNYPAKCINPIIANFTRSAKQVLGSQGSEFADKMTSLNACNSLAVGNMSPTSTYLKGCADPYVNTILAKLGDLLPPPAPLQKHSQSFDEATSILTSMDVFFIQGVDAFDCDYNSLSPTALTFLLKENCAKQLQIQPESVDLKQIRYTSQDKPFEFWYVQPKPVFSDDPKDYISGANLRCFYEQKAYCRKK